jgi:peptidoglycan L-alanyl-D-glutamate endopeptidase CwlK
MTDSRSLDDLHPRVAALARQLIGQCAAENIDLLVTCTWRDHAAQDVLYAQGRTRPGKIVTHAQGGQSLHNWRVAFDVVPLRGGEPVWGTQGADAGLWRRVGEIGEAIGLEWGGRWKFLDMPHFQYTAGLTLADFQSGRTLA